MVNYDLKELQARLLNILLTFDRVAREHGLRYCICGGTLLGAVRHGGFIPWDDDLDISMPRPDYERLIRECRDILPAPLEFVCAENDDKYPLPFGKIQDASTTLIERRHLYYLGGCYVDVFPFDAYPSHKLPRLWQCRRYHFLKQCLYLVHRDPYRHGRGPSSWAPLAVRSVFTRQQLQRKIRKVLTRYDFDRCELAASYTDGYGKVLPKAITGTYVPYEFEGHQVMGIRDYDPYLRCMYGDYMQVPPPEKRVQHGFDYLDLHTPYREYREKNE